jgi:ABC-type lipoprotein export system ATPase subunit
MEEVMSSYKGARWWKCDLQMQTPLSPHWREDETKLSQTDSEERKKEVASLYLQRCHEVGLDVIAITDHNFAPNANQSFISYLVDANREVAEALRRPMLHILPGFEIEAHIGRGSHVLAVFERDTELTIVDSKLSSLGLAVGARYQGGNPCQTQTRLQAILDEVQGDKRVPGLVIAAHPQDTGIFDNDRVADWLQQAEYKNIDLLALEIPKSFEQLSRGWQKLLGNGEDCHADWRRIRKIACVMSSDCYRLRTTDEDPHNFVGYRYTWIKMSAPTINAMRQAFLDPDSRIAFGPHSPDELRRHARIRSISIYEASYLENQKVDLAPGLTCIIGGRGTGKSTFLEYTRLALNKADEPQSGTNAANQVVRAKQTLSPSSKVRLEWDGAGGTEDTFEILGNRLTSAVVSREVLDQGTVFKKLGVQIFSQRQINDAGHPDQIFKIIESILGSDLLIAIEAEEPILSSLLLLFEKGELWQQANKKLLTIEQEMQDLQRQLDTRAAVKEEAEQYRVAKEVETYLSDAEAIITEVNGRIEEVSQETETCFNGLPEIKEDWPETDIVREISRRLLELSKETAQQMRALMTTFNGKGIEGLVTNPQVMVLRELLEGKKQNFLNACEEKGITPDDVAQIKELDSTLRSKSLQREEKRREVERLKEEFTGLLPQITALEECWHNQFVTRKTAIQRLVDAVNDAAREISGQTRLLDFEVRFQGQESDFEKRFWNIPPDGRTSLGRCWSKLGNAIHSSFVAQNSKKRIWAFIKEWMDGEEVIGLREYEDCRDDLANHLRVERAADWKERRVMRLADFVDFTLYRQDRVGGEEIAGKLSEGKLSDGQRNTVVLALLLVKNDGPILIDQPEDDIDSDFIFKYLVPVLRDRKDHRQIILVSHNPNIVVNGDADLVYALEFSGGKGRLRAQGGLDVLAVHDAVLDIMEGSEDAFRKRREKYGF